MKNALLIAYQFPPMGGSGVQRTAKFVKYLRNFGWEPTVLTRSLEGMELRDDSLLNELPEGIRIIRTKAYDLTALKGIFKLPGKFIGRKLFVPDAEMLWRRFSVGMVQKLISEGNFSLIYTTSYPYSDHLMGLQLKRKYPALPWVADFRDEWTKNPYLLDKPHNKLRMTIERKMEARVLKAADILITNTPVMLRNFLETDKTLKDKFYVIPNGYDSEDFAEVTAKPSNKVFTLTYTGLLYGRRKPDTFFEALSDLIGERKIDRRTIKVNLIGNFKTEELNDKINKYGLNGVVGLLPYMDHNLCLDKLMNSDALLLIEGDGPGAEAFYTGKIFEYIKTGRPILGVIPARGAAAGIINETRTGLVSDFSDIKGIGDNLYKLYIDWKEGRDSCSPENEKIELYDRRNLTKRLAELFDLAVSVRNN